MTALPWRRWIAAGGVLLAEYLIVTLVFDVQPLRSQFPWLSWAGALGSIGLTAVTAIVVLGRIPDSVQLDQLRLRLAPLPRAPIWVALHVVAAVAFFILCVQVLGGDLPNSSHPNVLVAGWVVALAAVAGTAFGLAIPFRAIPIVARLVVRPVLVGTAGGLVAWLVGQSSESAWPRLSRLTLEWTASVLAPIAGSDLYEDVPGLLLGIGDFIVEISATCSGVQGMGLMVVLTTAYIVKFRKSLWLSRAVWLVPLGIAGAFCANIIRIAALIWIGARFSPGVAMGGFHSKGGWLLTCTVALALLTWAGRTRFFRRDLSTLDRTERFENPTVPYLLPLLVSLAALLVTGAGVASFDWLYPVRTVFVTGVLIALARMKKVRLLPLDVSMTAVACGVVVFVFWFIVARRAQPEQVDTTKEGVASLSEAGRIFWLAGRVWGAVVIAPIVEELAFRGFLLRRVLQVDFDKLEFATAARRPRAVVVSAVAFGLLHQSFLAGTIAGILYGVAVIPRGRLIDAMVAHSVTNALLMAHALLSSDWRFFT